jgi:thymidine kinase
MNASKSAQLLIAAHNYEEQGKKVLCFSPTVDIRSGIGKIKSRISGLERDAIPVSVDWPETDILNIVLEENAKNDLKIACVFADEGQFYTDKQVEDFARVVDILDIPVIVYGLKTNFQGKLFSGSKRLLEIADKIEEVKTMCTFCDRKAHMVLRYVNGIATFSGPEKLIGGNETYKSVCREHFFHPIVEAKKQ